MTTLTVDGVGPWAMAESADDLMARLFHHHYRQLLRLAAVLVDDPSQCEEVVQEAFTRVYARSREAVMLRYYADLSVAETAAVMAVSEGAVKSYTSRGLDALATILADVR